MLAPRSVSLAPRSASLTSLAALVALALWLPAPAAAADVTLGGCECEGDCTRTINFDSLTSPWCYTAAPGPNTSCTTARYSATTQRYWDYCSVNATSTSTTVQLTTLSSMWATMTFSTAAALAAVYGVAGCGAAALASAKSRRAIWWVPAAALAFGACQGLLVGGLFAVIVSLMYLSIPSALDLSVAISLGLGLASLLVFASLGRHHQPLVPPHASEYAD